MAGETVITIIGNLTGEPELRTTRNGDAVCNVNIASNTRQYNSQSGQWEDGDTLFMRGTIWRDMAQHCAQSLHKGMRVIAQGRLTQHSWEDEQHQKRSSVELQVDEIGPSLRYATAQVQKIQSGNASQGNNGGFGGGYQQGQQQPAAGDPWGAAPTGQDEGFGAFGDSDF